MFNFNFKLKLTPVWLLLILLSALVIAVIYGVNTYKEGMVTFKRDDNVLRSIVVEWYQNPLYKLYDNNFLDIVNGNLIRVYEDDAGSIIKYTITERNGVTTDYSSGYKATIKKNMINAVKPWTVSNYDNYGYNNVTNNTLVYMPWGDDTFIRSISNTNTSFYIGGCTAGDDNCSRYSSEHPDISLTTPIVEPILSEVPETHKSLVTYITTKTNKITDGVYYDLSGGIYVFTHVDTAVPIVTVPDVAVPNTPVPVAVIPNTPVPVAVIPNTPVPVAVIPNTAVPTVTVSNIAVPSTVIPNTSVPVAVIPNTAVPTVTVPNVAVPSTVPDIIGTQSTTMLKDPFSLMEGLENKGKSLQIMMYKRDGDGVGSVIDVKPVLTLTDISTFNPWSLSVNTAKSILFFPRKTNTFVAVINKSGTKYTVEATSMYTPSEKLTVAPISNVPPITVEDKVQDKVPDKVPDKHTSWSYDDYILKTQVVPPVCPACPAYPGTCSFSGSSGGLNSSNSSAVSNYGATGSGKNIVSGGVDIGKGVIAGGVDVGKDAIAGGVGLGKDVIAGGVGLSKDVIAGGVGLSKDAISGGIGLVKNVVSGGVGLAKNTVTGGVGLAKDTVSGGVGLAKDTVSGGVGLAKDTVSGGVGLARDTVSGIGGLATGSGNGANGSGNRANGSGSRNNNYKTKNDVYTYNGALTNKESTNYIPLTADFSAFSR